MGLALVLEPHDAAIVVAGEEGHGDLGAGNDDQLVELVEGLEVDGVLALLWAQHEESRGHLPDAVEVLDELAELLVGVV